MPRTNRKTTITEKGIYKARKALNESDMPTDDFPQGRTINIINVKQMTDPQIQRCTSNPNQTLTINEHQELREIIESLKEAVNTTSVTKNKRASGRNSSYRRAVIFLKDQNKYYFSKSFFSKDNT